MWNQNLPVQPAGNLLSRRGMSKNGWKNPETSARSGSSFLFLVAQSQEQISFVSLSPVPSLDCHSWHRCSQSRFDLLGCLALPGLDDSCPGRWLPVPWDLSFSISASWFPSILDYIKRLQMHANTPFPKNNQPNPPRSAVPKPTVWTSVQPLVTNSHPSRGEPPRSGEVTSNPTWIRNLKEMAWFYCPQSEKSYCFDATVCCMITHFFEEIYSKMKFTSIDPKLAWNGIIFLSLSD